MTTDLDLDAISKFARHACGLEELNQLAARIPALIAHCRELTARAERHREGEEHVAEANERIAAERDAAIARAEAAESAVAKMRSALSGYVDDEDASALQPRITDTLALSSTQADGIPDAAAAERARIVAILRGWKLNRHALEWADFIEANTGEVPDYSGVVVSTQADGKRGGE